MFEYEKNWNLRHGNTALRVAPVRDNPEKFLQIEVKSFDDRWIVAFTQLDKNQAKILAERILEWVKS